VFFDDVIQAAGDVHKAARSWLGMTKTLDARVHARAIEDALADMIPVAIDLVAKLLNIGNIADKVQDIIEGVREMIDGAIDAMFETLLSALGLGGDSDQEDGEYDGQVGDEVSFSAGGEGHRLWVDAAGSDATVMVASTPMSVDDRLTNWQSRINDEPSEQDGVGGPINVEEARGLLSTAGGQETTVESEAEQTLAADEDDRAAEDQQVEDAQDPLAASLRRLFELYADENPAESAEVTGSMEGTAHTLTINPQAGTIILESTPAEARTKVQTARANLAAVSGIAPEQITEAEGLLGNIEAALGQIEQRISNGEEVNIDDLKALGQSVMGYLAEYGQLFHIEDIVSALDGYPEPQVGPHDMRNRAQGDPPPGGWVSHHVPPQELAVKLAEEMVLAASALQDDQDEAVVAFGDELDERQGAMRASGHGVGLSAILLNNATHMNSGGLAVHSGQIKAMVQEAMDGDDTDYTRVLSVAASQMELAEEDRDVVVQASTLQLVDFMDRVQNRRTPEDAEYQAAFASIFGRVVEEFRRMDGEPAQGRRAAIVEIQGFMTDAFNGALAQYTQACRTALSGSMVDGDHSQHEGVLSSLASEAETLWRPITNPWYGT
jgi:hypothetical protein